MSTETSGSGLKTAVITFFPMFIATLSLVTSIYNGFLNARFVSIIQGNVGRTEYMRTCKEIIDAYFEVKFRAGLIGAEGDPATAAARNEARHAVHKLGALGTYLANLRDEAIRVRYTELTRETARVVETPLPTPAPAIDARFTAADQIFAALNDDCVKAAKNLPLP
jgi:hypothetical protein